MRLGIFVATATAASVLLAGGAMADDNRSTIGQLGSNNRAELIQQGNKNKIGNPLINSTYGKVVQTGNDNALYVLQTGLNNDIASWSGGGSNVKQDGDRNSIHVQQLGAMAEYTGNAIYNIDQDSKAFSTALANVLQIVQGVAETKSRHVIGSVVQNNDIVANSQSARNSVVISQVGTVGYALGQAIKLVEQNGSYNTLKLHQSVNNNLVSKASQRGAGNTGEIVQAGGQNTVALLSQDVKLSLFGGNSAYISLTGDRNGTGATGRVTQNGAAAFSTDSGLYSHEAFSGTAGAGANIVTSVEQAKIVQEGGSNEVSYIVSGNRNLFGFRQVGDENSAIGTVSGDGHQLAVLQQGNRNDLSFGQSGANNSAGISIVGNDNHLNVQQSQSGVALRGNVVTASITGNDNGKGAFGTSSSQFALANSNGLLSGDIFQSGDGNSVSLNTSSGLNKFAFKQSEGNGNTITANVLGGISNSSVGVQKGSDNTATMIQNGIGNATLFHQVGGSNTVIIQQ
jgi:hypothetical protein